MTAFAFLMPFCAAGVGRYAVGEPRSIEYLVPGDPISTH